MHEKTPQLTATKRERVGSRYAKRARDGGLLPAVVYGHGQDPLSVTIDARSAMRMIHKGEKVFSMAIQGEAGEQVVLLKDLQFDYLGTNVVHCDFARVDMNERVRTKVHVTVLGDPIGLKTAGHILVKPLTEVEIECRVLDMPDSIEINIEHLDVGQSVTAGQMKLPQADMKMLTDPHQILAQIVIAHEIKEAEEAVVAVEGAEPEVITAKKEEGEEGEAGAPAKGGKEAAGKPGAKEFGRPGAKEAGKPGAKDAAGKPGAKEAAKPGAKDGGGKPGGKEAGKPGKDEGKRKG